MLLIVGSCFFLFYLGLEFLPCLFLLVYLGAILVLFIFISMLLDLTSKSILTRHLVESIPFYSFIGLVGFFKIIYFFYFLISQEAFFINFILLDYVSDRFSLLYHVSGYNDSFIFLSLFNSHFCYLILVGFILLFAMLGSIALCVYDSND
jgi:NADH:ubiquinone oxidoreductase subunit 6 (subunit J)